MSDTEPDAETDEAPAPDGEPAAPAAPATPPETALGVILAAGAGSRFVGDEHKLQATINKKPLVWWATQHAITAGFREVLVIEGAASVADLVPSEASVVRNDDWEDGQSRSLHVAVHYATMFDYEQIVVGLGDQPFVPPAAWRRVANNDSPIAVASFDGQQTPPVRLSHEVWRMLPLDGDEGARQLLRSRPELVTPIPCPGSAVDVDTAGELAQIRRHHLAKELGSWT